MTKKDEQSAKRHTRYTALHIFSVRSDNIKDIMKEIKCINCLFSPWKTKSIDRKAAVIVWYKAGISHRGAVEDYIPCTVMSDEESLTPLMRQNTVPE